MIPNSPTVPTPTPPPAEPSPPPLRRSERPRGAPTRLGAMAADADTREDDGERLILEEWQETIAATPEDDDGEEAAMLAQLNAYLCENPIDVEYPDDPRNHAAKETNVSSDEEDDITPILVTSGNDSGPVRESCGAQFWWGAPSGNPSGAGNTGPPGNPLAIAPNPNADLIADDIEAAQNSLDISEASIPKAIFMLAKSGVGRLHTVVSSQSMPTRTAFFGSALTFPFALPTTSRVSMQRSAALVT